MTFDNDTATANGAENTMGLFKGIEDASSSEGRNYIGEGIYDIVITKCTSGETRKKIGFFAVDVKFLGSNNTKHTVGSVANWITMADKDAFLGNVKAFIRAVLQNGLPAGTSLDESEITEALIEEMLANDAANIVGQKLRLQVTQKPTSSGGTYSYHGWYPTTSAA